ncbi:MAG: hypothetical protein ACODAQ_01750 [Phycisphaeraceae bacterium]
MGDQPHDSAHGGVHEYHHEKAQPPSRAEIEKGHLAETANTRGLWIFGGLLLVGLVLAVVVASGVLWMYSGHNVYRARRGIEAALPTGLPAPGTAHWVNPSRDLEALRRAQAGRLEGYGWMDREAGMARIPIEAAMTILAERAEADAGGAGQQGEGSRSLIERDAEQGGGL